MASSRTRQRISRFTFGATAAVATLSWATGALASQGPGVATGTASHFTQLAMAIIVWGASALVVGIGLVGAMRRGTR
jgi:hypothetical protein